MNMDRGETEARKWMGELFCLYCNLNICGHFCLTLGRCFLTTAKASGWSSEPLIKLNFRLVNT